MYKELFVSHSGDVRFKLGSLERLYWTEIFRNMIQYFRWTSVKSDKSNSFPQLAVICFDAGYYST